VEILRRPPTSDEPWDVPQIPDGNIGRIVVAGGTPAGRRPPPELQDSNIAGVVLITL
jgi:hypothetical protein